MEGLCGGMEATLSFRTKITGNYQVSEIRLPAMDKLAKIAYGELFVICRTVTYIQGKLFSQMFCGYIITPQGAGGVIKNIIDGEVFLRIGIFN